MSETPVLSSPIDEIASVASSFWSSFVTSASEVIPFKTVDTPPALSADSAVVLVPARSWGKWAQFSAGACTTASLLYALYRKSQEHYTHVTITETLRLPPNTLSDFVEVCMPLEGEVRVSCSTLAHCKYQLKLNASNKSDQGRVRDDNAGSKSSKTAVALTKVNKSELCDTWLSDYTGNLHFSPQCVSTDALLMTYESTSHESLQPAVSILDCYVEPASSQMTHRLTFNLHVFSSAMDVAVTMMLPKGSRILKVSTGGKGSVSAASIFAPHELTWNVGTFVREADESSFASSTSVTPNRKGRTVLKTEGATHQEGQVGYDTIPDFTLNGRNGEVTSLQDEADLGKTIGASATFNGISNVEKLAREQMTAMTERSSQIVPFEMIYSINVREAEEELNKLRTSSQATAAMVANNRRERRQMEREAKRKAKRAPKEGYRTHAAVAEISSDDDEESRYRDTAALDLSHISFDPSEHTPGVHLSYSTQAAASGLSVRKLLTSADQRNYNLLEDLLGPAPVLSEDGSNRVYYSARQKLARRVINTAADTFFTIRRIARLGYRRLHSLAKGTPMILSQEEMDEEEVYRAANRPPADISSLLSPNSTVRVPPSIVKQLKQADNPTLNASTRMQSTSGRNPFLDAARSDDNDEFVRVDSPVNSLNNTVNGPRVAFAVDDAEEVKVVASPPRETFVDKMIKELNATVPKLSKRVRYITRFSQQVKVSAQF